MDSDGKRLPGIVRRPEVLANGRAGFQRAASGRPVSVGRRPAGQPVPVRATVMEVPTRDARGSYESRLRRAWNAIAPVAEAVWEHLKVNWTDALLALGFFAVILLSTYVLLKG
jgi:hypothetical protein